MGTNTMTYIGKLPEKDVLKARLNALTGLFGDRHMRERLDPLILQNAGKEFAGAGVAIRAFFAVSEYTKNHPPLMLHFLFKCLDQLMAAMTDDPHLLAEAISYWKEMEYGLSEYTKNQNIVPAPLIQGTHSDSMLLGLDAIQKLSDSKGPGILTPVVHDEVEVELRCDGCQFQHVYDGSILVQMRDCSLHGKLKAKK
jgi:hypothetical protein